MEGLNIIDHFVPSYTKGRKRPVKFGVLHFVSARYFQGYENDPYNIEGVLRLFDELGPVNKFSTNFLISREGEIYCLVRTEDTAWHAGKSVVAMPEYFTNLNDMSVGIELVGMTEDPYTTKQYQALAKLAVAVEDDVAKLGIGQVDHWVGHDWVSGEISVLLGVRERAKIKVDPGTLLDFEIFYREKYRLRLEHEVRNSCRAELRDEILAELTAKQCLSMFLKKMTAKKT